MHKVIVGIDYDAEHLINLACLYIYPKSIDSELPYENELIPEVLDRDEIFKQLQNGTLFYVLDLDEHNKAYHIQILIHPHENGEMYIKPVNDPTNHIPGDYLHGICSITEWIGNGSDKEGQDFMSNPRLSNILNQ
jgi:hypothetical protein